MAKVVVVGGGVAGISAALAAARLGAATTLVESSNVVGLSKALLPSILSEGKREGDLVLPDVGALAANGIELKTGHSVTRISNAEKKVVVGLPGKTAQDSKAEGTLKFDSLVLCTGARPEAPDLRGLSKPNVFLLRGPSDYVRLASRLGEFETVAVSGPIPLALRLGEILANRGKRAKIFCGAKGLERQFSEPIANGIREHAASMYEPSQVSLLEESVDSIMGVERAEAVGAAGFVHTCDAVVMVPRSVPSFPTIDCDKGRNGGILVDNSMSTSLPGIFAAGDSAEIRFKSGSVPARLFSTSKVCGDVAGTNAAGGNSSATPSWSVEQTYFGLDYCSAGLSEEEASSIGLEASTAVSESGEGELDGRRLVTLVSMVFDNATHQVYGIQAAGRRASSLSSAASLIVALGLSVEQLVNLESSYHPGPGNETSPIALTARKVGDTKGA